MLYIDSKQVTAMIKRAEKEDEVIVIRCVRKTSASKPGGPDKGQLYDLHCAKKPDNYPALDSAARKKEDRKNGVLTVFVVNRRDDVTKMPGAWRRVNIHAVVKVIYKTTEYRVKKERKCPNTYTRR